MTTTKKAFEVPARPPLAAPLKGYAVKEDGEQVWVQDQQSTWIIDAKDVIGRSEWAGVADSRFSGKPGIFHIRDGAEISEVRTVKIKAALNWPLAIADKTRGSEVVGASNVDALASERLGELQVRDLVSIMRRATYTYCTGPDGKKYICDNAVV